jgi:hypothetical protein
LLLHIFFSCQLIQWIMFSSSFRNHTADFAKNADFSSYEYYLTKLTNLFRGEGKYPGLVQSTCGYVNCSFQTQRPAHCCPVEVSILVRHYKSLSFKKLLRLHPSFIIKCSCTCKSRLCGASTFHTLYSVICE